MVGMPKSFELFSPVSKNLQNMPLFRVEKYLKAARLPSPVVHGQ